jgi:tetratricopeptide (TPR) repeat protein
LQLRVVNHDIEKAIKQIERDMSKQTVEADKLVNEAKKMSTRGLFNLSPDYDGAAVKYEKAGTLYKVAGKNDLAIQSFKLAGDNHMKANNDYLAGKNYENAGNVYRDAKQLGEAATEFELAGKTYLEGGKPDRCSEVWIKAAKMLEKEPKFRDRCIQLYTRAVEAVTNDDKDHLATDAYRQLNAFLVREKLYREAVDNIQKQIQSYKKLKQETNLHKAYLSVVILHLALDDYAEADTQHNKFQEQTQDYGMTDEAYIASNLLQAFANHDAQALEEALKNNKLKFLENEIAKLVKRLKIGTVTNVATKAPSSAKVKQTKQKAALLGDSDEEESEEEPEPEPSEPDMLDPYDLT